MNNTSKKLNGFCLIVEDQPQANQYLRETLQATFPDLQIISFESVRSTEAWLEERSKENQKVPLALALIDLGLPDGNGQDLIRILSVVEPSTPSVVVTIYDDDARLFGALSAGAYSYILKDDGSHLLGDILQRILRDEPPLSPAIAHRLLAHFRVGANPLAAGNTLTSREIEVLTFIARGFTVPETAKYLSLSAQTVAGYVKNIYQKLHISNRAEATREAIRLGLVGNGK